jgi:hypothetical protein
VARRCEIQSSGEVDAAGPDPAYLPGPDQAAGFQHLDVLKDSGQ